MPYAYRLQLPLQVAVQSTCIIHQPDNMEPLCRLRFIDLISSLVYSCVLHNRL
jgi:hypothetical protein